MKLNELLREDEEETGLASNANKPEFDMTRDEKYEAQQSGEAYARALRKKNKEPDWNKVKGWGKSFKSGFRMGWGSDDPRLKG